MVPLNAINPLDSFNKGLKIMFYVQENTRGARMQLPRRNPYNLWLMLMFLLGDTNGLSMRLKEKTPRDNGTC